jgi:hypothetical protein
MSVHNVAWHHDDILPVEDRIEHKLPGPGLDGWLRDSMWTIGAYMFKARVNGRIAGVAIPETSVDRYALFPAWKELDDEERLMILRSAEDAFEQLAEADDRTDNDHRHRRSDRRQAGAGLVDPRQVRELADTAAFLVGDERDEPLLCGWCESDRLTLDHQHDVYRCGACGKQTTGQVAAYQRHERLVARVRRGIGGPLVDYFGREQK